MARRVAVSPNTCEWLCRTATHACGTCRGNAPTRATQDHIAGSIASAIDAPIVNIGPWGRDYHQRTERLYMPYAFDVLPELVWRVLGATLHESRP